MSPVSICANGYAAYKRAYMNHGDESMIIRSMRNSSEFKATKGSTDSPLSAKYIPKSPMKVRKGVGYLNSPQRHLEAKTKGLLAPSTFSHILSTEKI